MRVTGLFVLMFGLVVSAPACQQTGGGESGGGGGGLPVFAPATSQIVIGSLPGSRVDFESLWARTATSPEGAAACFIVAAMMLETNPSLGEECMTRVASPEGNNVSPDGKAGFSFRELVRRMREQAWIARSYVQGATPQNGYSVPAPMRFVFDSAAGSPLGQPGGNKTKVFVVSSGADSPRPVTVSREGNEYRIWEASSISVGVRKPAR